jgi:hypothetical protein
MKNLPALSHLHEAGGPERGSYIYLVLFSRSGIRAPADAGLSIILKKRRALSTREKSAIIVLDS